MVPPDSGDRATYRDTDSANRCTARTPRSIRSPQTHHGTIHGRKSRGRRYAASARRGRPRRSASPRTSSVRESRLTRRRVEKVPVPRNGLRQPRLERPRRDPPEPSARLTRIEVLILDFGPGLVEDERLEVFAAEQPLDGARDLEHRHARLGTEVERLALDVRISSSRSQREDRKS